MKIVSWNVNGIRAVERKGFLNWLHESNYDIVCVQETKVSEINLLSGELVHPMPYQSYWKFSTEKKGYSGVAVFSLIPPISVKTEFDEPHLNDEGRVIQLEFEDFYLFNIYFPNGGQGPHRIAYKLDFYKTFLNYIDKLKNESKKNIVFVGDVNTAHKEIDLARPKQNRKTSGFMPIECEWLDKFEEAGYIDTFRLHNQSPENYTWWDYKTRARERNIGWRIDYVYVNSELKDRLKDAFILNDVFGSDHCPVGIEMG